MYSLSLMTAGNRQKFRWAVDSIITGSPSPVVDRFFFFKSSKLFWHVPVWISQVKSMELQSVGHCYWSWTSSICSTGLCRFKSMQSINLYRFYTEMTTSTPQCFSACAQRYRPEERFVWLCRDKTKWEAEHGNLKPSVWKHSDSLRCSRQELPGFR